MGKIRPNQNRDAPAAKAKVTSFVEDEPASMKEKVAREIELAKVRKQIPMEKPKKVIKKKKMSTKARVRHERLLERGLADADKVATKVDKNSEKVAKKKRGKQMWE
ncbi:hypothetical protein DFQ27_006071 [Actinomortierella ambigua]|uniref:Uncharacterized protein n=1 Tax=Actinomortierella ambigua TaxID=1343610 RepID=A0A9P6Q090_9FUNG|nr:hypothetical protein DFQ27_006071 [Actinomortierella ambigua]